MNTAAWPSPVMTEVRSVPHMTSTRSEVIVPSWGPRAVRPAGTLVRQQAVLAHQPQDAASAGADAGEAQPGPQLAVALAMKGAVSQELPDRRHQLCIRRGAERPG